MIDETPIHRAPNGIVLGLLIMIAFYAALGMTIRLCGPSPAHRCDAIRNVMAVRHPLDCKPGRSAACLCAPR